MTLSVLEQVHNHFRRYEVEYLQFAFRWMNNLLMRELPLRCTIRLWDTYQVWEDLPPTNTHARLSLRHPAPCLLHPAPCLPHPLGSPPHLLSASVSALSLRAGPQCTQPWRGCCSACPPHRRMGLRGLEPASHQGLET